MVVRLKKYVEMSKAAELARYGKFSLIKAAWV
jgi:hypothetical protein